MQKTTAIHRTFVRPRACSRACFRVVLNALCVLGTAALLASCGASGLGDSREIIASSLCDVASQQRWLKGYMDDAYLWRDQSPKPEPAGYASVLDYFRALLYTGGTVSGVAVPADHWSYIESASQYAQFFGEGKTMGYGVSVNGVERVLPLKVRYVELQSPGALAGLQRGETIVSANGRTAAEMFSANDFSAFSAANEGDTLTLVMDAAGVQRTVVLRAATFALTPVSAQQVFTLPSGAKAGYVVLKDFVSQAEAPLAAALASFRTQGATELILDLRYNGGGLVSTAGVLASLVTGSAHAGEVFTQLRFNGRNSAKNTTYRLGDGGGAKFNRVVVLTGSRTCSASELVVNGLKPYYAEVVTVGGTTCGKPVGFSPRESCSSIYSAVNFESVNANGQGGYYSGIAATCAVADDFNRSLGDAQEKLTAAALGYLGTGSCPASSAGGLSKPLAGSMRDVRGTEPGERSGMWAQ